MNALLLLYALTLSLELLLSLLMAIFLYLIIAPRSPREPPAPPAESVAAPTARSAASTVTDPTVLAIQRALETIARSENDLQTLVQTRRVLQLAERDLRQRALG